MKVREPDLCTLGFPPRTRFRGDSLHNREPTSNAAPRASGDDSVDQLFQELNSELRGLAGAIFTDQHVSHTLQPTVLINEAWLKLSGKNSLVNDKQHFLALAARVMRQILADHARGKSALKRGGHRTTLTLHDGNVASQLPDLDAIAFHDALERLSQLNRRHAEVVEYRILGTLRIPEIAEILGVSENTVLRDWQAARLWLRRELAKG